MFSKCPGAGILGPGQGDINCIQSARVACWGTLIESLHLSCRHASASSVPSQFSRPGEGYESHKIDTLFKTMIYLWKVAINILGAIEDTYIQKTFLWQISKCV